MIDVKVIIPDAHIPWVNWDILREARDHVKHYQNKKKKVMVISVGDISDQKAWSRFPKDPDDFSPHQEWLMLEEGMERMHEWFPELTIVPGNHDIRTMKSAFGANLPQQLIRSIEDCFDFPLWEWRIGKGPLVIDDVMICHGDETGGSAIAKAKRLGMSVVQGHDHQMYLEYINTFHRRIFGLGVGCCIDPAAIAFRYAAKNPVTCGLGFAEIVYNVPHLIPYY